MEGWSRLQKEKVVGNVVEVPEDDGEELGVLETKERRQDMKRAGEDVQEGLKPKRRRKVKFPRLEDWGEMTQEVEIASAPQPVEMYKLEVVEQCDKTAYIHQTADLVDKETNTLLRRSSKLQAKKLAISKEVQKAKFKYNTRGKLRKDEIIEIKRTHKPTSLTG